MADIRRLDTTLTRLHIAETDAARYEEQLAEARVWLRENRDALHPVRAYELDRILTEHIHDPDQDRPA